MSVLRLLALLTALLAGAFVADLMTRDPGYVLLTWGDYALETSLGVAALALLILAGTAVTVYVSLRGIVRTGYQIANWTRDASPDTHRLQLSQRAERLLLDGKHGALRRRLDQALPSVWDSTLLDCYGLVEASDPKQRLERATAWLEDHPNDAALLLCLGRLSIRCAQWGQAETYCKRSLEVKATPAACAELARLEARQGNPEASQALVQRGLALSVGPLAELPS